MWGSGADHQLLAVPQRAVGAEMRNTIRTHVLDGCIGLTVSGKEKATQKQ
jgi:hypothetical protein